ncbi:MAG: methyl-accepting chemotaxis protein [Lachnospiraceae bacterium]|nr:methyl-accepting chemotaxis protein [Lachnospiraceae bacterium]
MKKLFSKSNMSFMTALQLLVLPLVICLIISIIVMGYQMDTTYNETSTLYYDTLYQINSKLVNGDRDFYQAMVAAEQYMSISQSEGALPPEVMDQLYAAKVAVYDENLGQLLERVNGASEIAKANPDIYTETVIDGKNYKTYEEEFYANYDKWLNSYDYTTNEGDITEFNEQFEIARDSLSCMTDVVELWAEQEAVAARKAINHKALMALVVFFVIAALLYVQVIFTARSLSAGIKRISKSMDNMGNGDFATDIDFDSPIKEFKAIGYSAENMRTNLQNAIGRIIGNAQSVDNVAVETKEKIEDSQRSTADINQAVSDLAAGATDMANDVQTTLDITVQIGNAVTEVLGAANSNLENGRAVINESTRVQGQLSELMATGENTRNKAKMVSDSVTETAHVVSQISQSADLIISIASQTNLLALNASIEAARAGEAGKGFAVVADNIKDLAAESNDAANEITGMLKQISTLSERNRSLTEDIRTATEDEGNALGSMSDSFKDMLNLLKESEEGNNQIVELVQSLDDNKNSILDSVESLSSLSQENAASTEETSAALSMLDNNMENVVEQAETLKMVADELRENVGMFTI